MEDMVGGDRLVIFLWSFEKTMAVRHEHLSRFVIPRKADTQRLATALSGQR